MQDLSTEYKGRILAVDSLPALPHTLHEVTRLMEAPDASTEQIARIISLDQALTSRVLRMVNSPVYGFPGRISSLQHAIMLLGFNVIRGLIISTVAFDAMNKGMRGLWEHSMGCSLCCAEIARIAGKENPEEFAVAGLLHDLGKAVFILQVPEAKDEVVRQVEAYGFSFFEAESKVLGFSHDRINNWLAEHWNLPLVIRQGMVYHHNPMAAEFYPDVAAAVQLADFFVRLFGCGYGGDDGVNAVDPRSLKILGLSQKKMELLLDTLGDHLFGVIAQYGGLA
jgi:HD-like signal output (HDOD) protein